MGSVMVCCAQDRDEMREDGMAKPQLERPCNSSEEAMTLLSCQHKLALLKTHSASQVLPSSVAILAKTVPTPCSARMYGDTGQRKFEPDHSLHGAFDEQDFNKLCLEQDAHELVDTLAAKNIEHCDGQIHDANSAERMFEEQPETESPLLNPLVCSHVSARSGQDTPEQKVSLEKPIEIQGSLFHITFERQVGPNRMDLLTVVFHPVAASLDNIAEGVDLLGRVCREEISGDFVAVWDISQMRAPSPFRYPAYSGLLKKRMQELGAFQTSQQGFAVIRGDSLLFNRSVDLMVALCKAETVPIFANDLAESLKFLHERFA